ncbi:hypothetical protein F5972_09005 [Microbispora cellulosiformans]|uniref:Uncharacterized protein n=1 Tax=Microbispora cellulosiformans TaxID=2614688 RepID=A0A5J5K592_9ACTN|nr:hypothetical protein [Microbispora cellulosiformans]KAA9379771.1 hypothetical protein F5972_09005 [Microbispora cellulosiformans]
MGWFDALLGRSKAAKPDLDALFALPSAAVTLRAATGFAPAGTGSVCFRAAEGGAFARLQQEIEALMGETRVSQDAYGYTWLSVRNPDVAGLVTDLHAANSSLESAGFGPSLLCTLVTFADSAQRKLAIVYLYKRGTFYPFAPAGEPRRDNALELQVRGVLDQELKIEPDLASWFPVWGAPGL